MCWAAAWWIDPKCLKWWRGSSFGLVALVKGFLLFVKHVNLTQSGAYMVLKIKMTDQYLINSGNQRRIFPPNNQYSYISFIYIYAPNMQSRNYKQNYLHVYINIRIPIQADGANQQINRFFFSWLHLLMLLVASVKIIPYEQRFTEALYGSGWWWSWSGTERTSSVLMEDVCMLKHGLLPKNHKVSCVMISLHWFF